ncbi:MAG: T9SS type A sorting domain-containing protein [Prevotella sp.]|nr:T9SS type A sorting domain-containing protein [Prevotella sp.]
MKSSLYNHIRILLISLFTLVANGAAWGQTFGDPNSVSSSYTFKRYLKTSNATTTPIISDTEANELYSIIVSKLAEQASRTEAEEETILQNQAYVRWFISKDGVLQDMNPWEFRTIIRPNEQWPFTKHYIYGFYWFPHKDRWNDAVDVLLELLRIKSITNYSSLNLSNYNIELVVSDEADLSADVYNGYGGNWQGTEPTLKLRFIWEFNETGEAPVDPFENVPNELTPTQGTKDIYEYTAPTNITINLQDYNNSITTPSYIRWCFADNNGNVVDNPGFDLSNGDIAYNTQGQSIYFGGTTTNANENLLNITVTPQAGKSFADLASYKLVAYLSNELGTIENEALTKEPLISSKYEISFNFVPFASELPEASKRHTSTIIVNDENATSVSLPLSDHWETIKADLGSETVNYLRYYLLDASDNVVTTGSLSSDKGINFENNNIIGNYWLKPSETAFDKDMLDFTATVTSGKISDYKFVILLSSKDAIYDGMSLAQEPILESMFTYSIGVEPAKEVTILKLVENDAKSVTLNLYDDMITDIKSKYTAEEMLNFYLKWYLRDKETKEPYLPVNCPFTYTTAYSLEYLHNYGLTWCSNDQPSYGLSWVSGSNSGYTDDNLKKVFNNISYSSTNLPEGKNINDYEIVCVMTNDLSGLVEQGGYRLKEPAFQHKYVYQLITNDEAENAFTEGSVANVKTIKKELLVPEGETKDLSLTDIEFEEVKKALGIETVSNMYVRWYVENAETGERIEFELLDSPFTSYDDSYEDYRTEGLIWYSGSNFANTTLSPSTHLRLTYKSSDNTWKNRNVVCLLTDNQPETLGQYITKEPNFEVKYIFSFVTKEELIQRGLQTTTFSSLISRPTEEATIVIDTDNLDDLTKEITTDSFKELFPSFYTNYYTLFNKGTGDNTDFYLRWFLVDGNNIIVTQIPNDVLTDGESNGYQNTKSSGLVYKQTTNYEGLKLGITYKRPTEKLWEDYKLACVMTTDMTGMKTVEDVIIGEPTNMQALFMVNFKPIYEEDDYFEEGVLASNAIERTCYQLQTDETEFVVDLHSHYNKLVKDFSVSALSALSDFYLRWYIIDNKTGKPLQGADGKVLSLKDYLDPISDDYEHAIQKYGLIWTTNVSEKRFDGTDVDANILNAEVTLPDGYTQKDVSLVCLMTNDMTDYEGGNHNLIVNKEPSNIKVKYTIKFITEDEAKLLNYTTSTLPNSNIFEAEEITIYDTEVGYTLNLKDLYDSKIASIFGVNTPEQFYLRWFIRDTKGNIINSYANTFTPTGNVNGHVSKGSSGMVWSSNLSTEPFEANEEQLNIHFTKHLNRSWNDFEVVCVMTDDLTGQEQLGNILLKEPDNLRAMAIFSFNEEKDHFRGYGDVTEKQYVTVEHYSQEEQTLSLTSMMETFSATKDILSASTDIYFRWFVTDKAGDRVENPGLALTMGNNQYKETQYGYIWYSGFLNDKTLTDDLWSIKVKATDSKININDYNVVCVFSTDMTGATFDSEGNFTKEPDTWMAHYVFDFQSEFEGVLAENAKVIYKTVVVADDATTTTIPLSNRATEIYEYFGKSIINCNELSSTNFHIRWTVINKENIEDYSEGNLVNSKYIEYNGYGVYWNTKANNGSSFYNYLNNQELLDITYNCSVDNWSNYKVVVLMTDNNEEADGTRIQTKDQKNTLVHEPNKLELVYIIDFKKASEINEFVHYKGITGSDFVVVSNKTANNKEYIASTNTIVENNNDIRQQTHEWTYEIYVDPNDTQETQRQLTLPIVDSSIEPEAYYRWYDWNTDMANQYLIAGSDLQEIYNGRGLFALKKSNVTQAMVGVKFDVPEGEDWEYTIACDVSKFLDGMDLSRSYLLHEPTLSYRYKYIVRPAKVIASAIMDGVKAQTLLENHGDISLGVHKNNTSFNLRLNLSDIKSYYFYPYNNGDWDKTKYYQANKLSWRIYDSEGKKISDIGSSDNNMFDFKTSMVEDQFASGELFYIVAFAVNGTKEAPIARFNCRYYDDIYPLSYDVLNSDYKYNTRTIDYLESHYTRVAQISFDIENGSTLAKPNNPIENINPMPFKWQRSHYGYCYPQLYHDMEGQAIYTGLAPLHGDYTILKSMNLSGISQDGNGDGYKKEWWSSAEVHDHTYLNTNGAQYGYFLYIDASQESRPIANVEFEGEMCTGSTLVLSAMVADMTSEKIKPQLIFKLYGLHTDSEGNETERKLIHSFATGDFSGILTSSTTSWYQVFAKVTLQNNTGVENYQRFLVSIDNYCGGTLGADYAIDDIRIYMQNSKVEVLQDAVLCGEDNLSATFKINYETLMAMMPSSLMNDGEFTSLPVYYRICNEYGEVVNGICPDEKTVIESDVVYVDKTFYTGDDADKKHHYQIDANGTKYFVLSKSGYKYKLDPGKKYYVSVAVPKLVGSNLVVDESTWGSPTSICSMYSEMFEPLKQNLKLLVSGSLVNKISVTCGESKTSSDFKITGALQIPDTSTGDMVSIQNPAACRFDWIIEEKTENFSSILNVAGIKEALSDYRNRNGSVDYTSVPTTGIEETDLVADKFSEEQRTLLNGYISSGKLFMLASADLTGYEYEVGKTYVITAIPLDASVTQTVNGETKSYDVCPEPMEVTVEARLDGPELNLGFSKVNYESAGLAYGADGLRVGLQQLNNMQQNDVPLHLPIYKYKIGGETQNIYSLCLDELGLVVVDSNDPTWNGKGENTTNYCDGTYRIGVDKNQHTITDENQSLEVYMNLKFGKIDLSSEKPIITETNDNIDFHEGYWYKVKFQYVKESSELENNYSNRCFGETYFTIKVVPEYVTWDKGLAANSNWLNDDNWNRSVKTDLYKDDYVDNGDEGTSLAELVVDGKPATFAYVPMKFTKVTILPNSNTPNPYLYNLEIDPHSRILKRTANGDNSAATPKIEYDMMVEVNTRECPYATTKTKVYECERFYGNTCKEIYFKPQAQLRWQHYLTYERAWVDMELETNNWYTLAAPLNDLVAGDMYVPTTGRQETEAFKPITFGDGYNRVTYPIYQRSWDKAGSKVMTLGGSYNADMDYGTWGDIATTWSQWSHVYNDVEEKYEPGKGYSIRVHHTSQAHKTLIRLPKDDTGYNYFDYAGNVRNLYKDGIHSADGDERYRLAADGVATGMLQLEVEKNNTDANKYYLIGNPYMASLKMDLFFYGNPHLEKKYWVIVKDELKSASDETGLGVVGPTQSFFVKTVDGSPVSSITLSPLMTTSNLITTANVASSGQTNNAKIRMSATDLDGRKSNVTVVLNDKASNDFVDAEDVELLHDSNLENVPQLYTVAGNQTAMVNSMSGIDNLPIGVMTAKNETVALTVNTLYGINDVLYLYDAKNNVQTELTEGMELMMETNQHGRYFITTRAIAEKGNMTEAKVNCYSPSQNLLVVSTTAGGDMIKEISIYDASGRMVKADASVDNISARYNLPQGIYIVKVMTDCSAGEIVNKTQVR